MSRRSGPWSVRVHQSPQFEDAARELLQIIDVLGKNVPNFGVDYEDGVFRALMVDTNVVQISCKMIKEAPLPGKVHDLIDRFLFREGIKIDRQSAAVSFDGEIKPGSTSGSRFKGLKKHYESCLRLSNKMRDGPSKTSGAESSKEGDLSRKSGGFLPGTKFSDLSRSDQKSFWKFPCVRRSLNMVFFKGEPIGKCAAELGVTPEMIINSSRQEHQILFVGERPKLLSGKELGPTDYKFWYQDHVVDMMTSVKNGSMSDIEVAMELGVSRQTINEKVSQIIKNKNDSREYSKPKKVKLNPLELVAENCQAIEVSDELGKAYAEIRMRNIQERLKMFEAMDFGDSKDCAKHDLKRPATNARDDLPLRGKSKRLQDKKTKEMLGSFGDKDRDEDFACEWTVPKAILRLEDLSSLHESRAKGSKFLSYLDAEFRGKRDKVKTDEEEISSMKLMGTCNTMTPYLLRSGDVYHHQHLPIVCVGDMTGHLGVWTPNLEQGPDEGVHCSFRVHSGPINCVTFNKFDKEVIFSSGCDGYLRIVDLNGPGCTVNFGCNLGKRPGNKIINHHEQICQNTVMVCNERQEIPSCRWYDLRVKSRVISSFFDVGPNAKVSHDGVNTLAIPHDFQVCLYDIRRVDKRFQAVRVDGKIHSSQFSHDGSGDLLVVTETFGRRSANIFKRNSEYLRRDWAMNNLVNPQHLNWMNKSVQDQANSKFTDRPVAFHSNGSSLIGSVVNQVFGDIDVYPLKISGKGFESDGLTDDPTFVHTCFISSPGGVVSLNHRRRGTVTLFQDA